MKIETDYGENGTLYYKVHCVVCGNQIWQVARSFYLEKAPCCSGTCQRTYAQSFAKVGEDSPIWKGGSQVSQERYRVKYPERYIATTIVNKAIKRGTLYPQPCEVCSSYKTEAHHEDYNKPLEVTWLCGKHHRELHNEDRKSIPNS